MNENDTVRHRRSRRTRLGLAGGCLVALGAGVATLLAHGTAGSAAPVKAVPLKVVAVQRGDLVTRQTYHGILGYRPAGEVHLPGAGTVTALPRVGQILGEGAVVAAVDDQPVGVLYGRTALYRTLGTADSSGAQLAVQTAHAALLTAEAAAAPPSATTGHGDAQATAAVSPLARSAQLAQAQVNVTQAHDRLIRAQRTLESALTPQHGPDVALVAADMAALGYYRAGPTATWSPALQDAVAQWQGHLGASATGELDPTHVLVEPGPTRVSAVTGANGDAPGAVSIALSSATRVATLSLHHGLPAAVAVGRRVRLSADGSATVGRIARVTVGRVDTTVAVAFSQTSRLARAHGTRVTISVRIADRRHVLTVPPQSLLALASGGYALQLPGGRLIAVRTGVQQGARIEVSGAGIHPGLRVVSVR